MVYIYINYFYKLRNNIMLIYETKSNNQIINLATYMHYLLFRLINYKIS